jgi:hypothetical protein
MTPKEQKDNKYVSVKNYKPSGNLVYGEDLLAKVEKKITFAS